MKKYLSRIFLKILDIYCAFRCLILLIYREVELMVTNDQIRLLDILSQIQRNRYQASIFFHCMFNILKADTVRNGLNTQQKNIRKKTRDFSIN